MSLSMLAVSAEANTSAGAPSWICATRSEEPPKLNSTVTPSCSFSNSSPICSNVEVSEAAANTVSVVSPEPPPSEPEPEPEPESESSPQAAAVAVSSRVAATRAAVRRAVTPASNHIT